MPKGLGFNAWMSTDNDKILQEFGIETDLENKVVRCWIPSEAGKRFNICWKNVEHLGKDICGQVHVDGTPVGGRLIRAGKANTCIVTMDSVITSETSCRRFLFSSLQLTDDDSLLGASSAQKIGDIVIVFHEVTVGNIVPARNITLCGQSTVHERSKKGLVHSISFTAEEKTSKQILRNSSSVKIIATFEFKYRPLDILRANKTAPPAPYIPVTNSPQSELPPEPVTKRKADDIKEEEDDDDSEEANELVLLRARVRELEEKRAKAKRVKTEPRAAFLPGEIIDLT
ncbi:hypothetical protein BDQ17DRAFT_1358436 [Cyathus striatus]|nr:hypothetical protein BDQ17DRAFT_1358436 [Cyathus striatus]